MPRALITGITGQDGAYLAKLLISKKWSVFGLMPRRSTDTKWRLRELGLLGEIKLIEGDVTDMGSILNAIEESKPDHFYNLAAQSFVGTSWGQPMLTASANGIGALNCLEAVRIVDKSIRFYQASTSELFGLIQEPVQSETTPFYPRSPYGVSKLFAHWSTINYRESHGMHACCGILFNHESRLRGYEFVSRKITAAAAMIKAGLRKDLTLGNLEAGRDWGSAQDYVEAMHLMLMANEPEDYVIATGKMSTVRDLCDLAFAQLGLDYLEYVRVDEKLKRPAEVDVLLGDASKAHRQLSWQAKTSLEEMVKDMVSADVERVAKGERF